MLRKLLLTALSLTLLATSLNAHAESVVKCAKDNRTNGKECTVSSSQSKVEYSKLPTEQKSRQPCTDALTGDPILCVRDGEWWHQDRQCYISVKEPQPDKSELVWRGNADGVIVRCAKLHLSLLNSYDFWVPDARPAPSPRVLAEEAVASMSLLPIRIGSYPASLADNPDALGLVGRWVWLWAKEPDERTWGPVTKTVSAAGHSVTATARVSHVVWDMGDGKTRTCWGPGTPWRRGNPEVDPKSPTCSYRYQKQGVRTITATSHWRVDWSGIGQRGTIHFSLDASAQIAIGELQVVNVNKPRR